MYAFESSYSYLEFLSHQITLFLQGCIYYTPLWSISSLPRWLGGKQSAYSCIRRWRFRLSPWAGKIPWRGNINPFHCFCLGNSMDKGTWQVTVRGVTRAGHNLAIVVPLLAHFQLFATLWTAARQASLSFTISWSFLRLMSIESVIPSNHLILCCPLLLLPSILPSIRGFSNESALCIRWPKYWSFSFNNHPSNEYSEFMSFRNDWFDFLSVQGTLKSLLQYHIKSFK